MPEQNVGGRSSGLAVMSLQERIRSQSAAVGIMGLGYVGLTEAIEFARSGFRVTGFDVDINHIQHIHIFRRATLTWWISPIRNLARSSQGNCERPMIFRS
jgi:hypothetical protein